MKISHLLEATSPLQAFISQHIDQFQQVGNSYLFIWTDDLLKSLIKAGVKANRDLKTVSVPNEIGLGIVNPTTGAICVGAIDDGYEALWASSDDVSDFFAATRNRKLIQLPNRLQNLADMLKRAAEPEAATGGVDGIVEYIEEEGIESLDVDAIKAMDSVDEVRDYLETIRDEEQAKLDSTKEERAEIVAKAKALLKSGDKKGAKALTSQIRELTSDVNITAIHNAEDILDQHHLFRSKGTDGIDSDLEDNDDAERDIDKWTRSFNRDFPDLDLTDAREFGLQ